MLNIFLAYSGKDDQFITDKVIAVLESQLSSDHYMFFYYRKKGFESLSMEEVLKKIPEMDLFILFISQNSIDNEHVKEELYTAIKEIHIKKIYGINIDKTFDSHKDNRIPESIRNNIYDVKSEKEAVEILLTIFKEY